MSRALLAALALLAGSDAFHMTPPARLTRASTACHAEKPAVSRADFLSGLALGASAIAAPAFAETPRNDVTSYDKIPNQSGLQKKVVGGFSADYITVNGVDKRKIDTSSTKGAALAKRAELEAAAKARKEELKAKGKADAAAVLEANKARGQAGKDAAANLKAAKAAKKEEGKAASKAKREADLAAQAEKAAAKKAKKAAAKK